MNRLLKAAAALVCAFGFQFAASAQMTNITAAANSLAIGGSVISTGTVTIVPVNVNGIPIPIKKSGGGLVGPGPMRCAITSGILGSCPVPDASLTTPANILYTITLKDTSTGNDTSGLSFVEQAVAGISGATWGLDQYAPPASTTAYQGIAAAHGPTVPTSCNAPAFYTLDTTSTLEQCVGGVYVPVTGSSPLPATATSLGVVQLPVGQTATQLAKVAVTGQAGDLAGALPHAQLPALVSADIPANAANTTGNASTATALAVTPSLCPAGQAPTGILPNGNATGCSAAAGGGAATPATTALLKGTGSANGVGAATPGTDYPTVASVTSAASAASAAQATANTANTAAGAAQSTANTAVTNAATAQSAATAAGTSASAAQTTANSANTAATTAATNAAAAQTTANAAMPKAGGAFTGPVSLPKLNSTLYVAGTSTYQTAVTAACAAGGTRVVALRGATPSDTISAVTGGCSTVDIEDQTSGQTGAALYTWNGTAYTKGAAGNGRIAFGVDNRVGLALPPGMVGQGIVLGGTTGNPPTYKWGNWQATKGVLCGSGQAATLDAQNDYTVNITPCTAGSDYLTSSSPLSATQRPIGDTSNFVASDAFVASALSAFPLGYVPALFAITDSIGASFNNFSPLSAFTYLLATDLGGTMTDFGQVGGTSFQQDTNIYNNLAIIPRTPGTIIVHEIGKNNELNGGADTNQEAAYGSDDEAQLFILGTNPSHLTNFNALPGSAFTGAWTGGTFFGASDPGMQCTGTGCAVTFTFTGTKLGIVTGIHNAYTSTASLTCDGTATGTALAFAPGGSISLPGATSGQAFSLTTLASGSHSCTIAGTSAGTITLELFGGLPGTALTDGPMVIETGLTDQATVSATTAAYRAYQSANVTALRAIGYSRIGFADMTGVIGANGYNDGITHPNEGTQGHWAMETVVLNTISSLSGAAITQHPFFGSPVSNSAPSGSGNIFLNQNFYTPTCTSCKHSVGLGNGAVTSLIDSDGVTGIGQGAAGKVTHGSFIWAGGDNALALYQGTGSAYLAATGSSALAHYLTGTNVTANGALSFNNAASGSQAAGFGDNSCGQATSISGMTCLGSYTGSTLAGGASVNVSTDANLFLAGTGAGKATSTVLTDGGGIGRFALTGAQGAYELGPGTCSTGNGFCFKGLTLGGVTKFTATGCSNSATVGNALVGGFTSGVSGTCTVVITPGFTAANGFACRANDLTTPADTLQETATTTTTVTLSGTTVTADVINFNCSAY